jgi:hypothetical protein
MRVQETPGGGRISPQDERATSLAAPPLTLLPSADILLAQANKSQAAGFALQ